MECTIDDNDQSNHNYAQLPGVNGPNGGWWYNNCWEINPNNYYKHEPYGVYLNGKWSRRQPIHTRMMIRSQHSHNVLLVSYTPVHWSM